MPTLRYLCLSDLHLGADNSLLTFLTPQGQQDPLRTPSVLKALARCLHHLLDTVQPGIPATFVFNGDLLETSIAPARDAAMGFDRFVEQMYPLEGPQRFTSEMVYVPGNHDHHQWQVARDILRARTIAQIPPGQLIPPGHHTTPIFGTPRVESSWVGALARRHPPLARCNVGVAYPNFGMRSEDGRKAVVFHHGHFLESTYRAMTTVINLAFPDRSQPLTVDEIEAENGQWIDFFWSTLGSTGTFGANINQTYKALQNEATTDALVRSLARSIAALKPSGFVVDKLEEAVLRWVVGIPLGRVSSSVRSESGAVLNPDSREGLDWYVDGPLRAAMGGQLPEELAFVFGHTHKPFTEAALLGGQEVSVYNTGGWVVDTEQPAAIFGGSIVLVDEALNVVNLRIYNESPSGAPVEVRAESVTENPLLDRIRAAVQPTAEPWAELAHHISKAVPFRNRVLQASNASLADRLSP